MDISSEMIIQPYGNGVILSNPLKDNSTHTVSYFMDLPMNVYFMDNESIIRALNETTADTCGFNSLKSALGQKITKAAKKESAEFSMRHDKTVMSIHHAEIAEENFIRKIDDLPIQFISVKLPWYDSKHHQKIRGIFGFTISPLKHGLARSLALVAQSKLVKINNMNYLFRQIIDNTYLSKRELHCFTWLAKGYPIKMIAEKMKLSSRTVEHYLENIKIKLNVNSRQDLIKKAYDNNVCIS